MHVAGASARLIGRVVLVLSGLGYPLSQLAIWRFGARGALLVEAVSGGLLVRDAALLATGVHRRLRRGPALLLWGEAMIAAAATVASLPLLLDVAARERARGRRATRLEMVRRVAVGMLFGVHTLRFQIYLTPGRGLRRESAHHPGAGSSQPARTRPYRH